MGRSSSLNAGPIDLLERTGDLFDVMCIFGLRSVPSAPADGINLRSRCQRKAWGASPRIPQRIIRQSAKRAAASLELNTTRGISENQTVARYASLQMWFVIILGLTPQALRFHLLRRFRPPPALFVH